MVLACEQVEKAHIDLLPSPFLSSVIDNCMKNGVDVTNGGAKYNFSAEKPVGRKNNRKMTFDSACRVLLFDVAKKHGLQLEEEPRTL